MLLLVTIGFACAGKRCPDQPRPSSSTFEQHCKTSQQHLRFILENRPLQPRELTLLTFFPAKRSSGNPSPQPTTMATATSTPITEQSVVPAELPLPPPPCPKVLPFGFKDANHLRRAYPLLRHGHVKASWRLVDGLGLDSVDPPCTGEGSYDSTGCIVPCSPCAGVRGSVVLHRWMVEARGGALSAVRAQCVRSATIWASGRTGDPCFEIIGASSLPCCVGFDAFSTLGI